MAQKNVNIANQSTGVQAYTSNPGSYTALQINNAINSSSTTPPASPLSISQGDTIEMICYEGQSQFSVEFRVDPNDTFIPGNTGEQASGTDTGNASGQTWATLPTTGTWTVTSSNTGTYSMKIVQRTYESPKSGLVTNTKYLWFTVASSGSAPTSFTTQPSWNSGNANSGATASLSTSPVANGSPAPTYSYSESSSLLSINSSTGVITWSSANNSTSSRTATVTCTATNASGSLNTNRTVTQLGGPGVSGTYAYSQEVSSGGTESPTGSPTFTGTAGNWAVTSAGGSSSNGATINTSNGTITWSSNSGSSSRSVTVYRSIARNGYSRWLSVGSASQEGSGGSGGTTTGTITEAQTYTHVRTEGSNYITTASSGATRTIFDVSTQASTGTASVTNTANSNSHTISYSPAATGTYTFTIRRRDQSAYYDSFAEFWLWQTDTTTLYDYSITVNPSAPSADTSVTVGQPFTSGTTATGTVSGSGGSGGTINYILKTSSSTPTAGDGSWQSSDTFTGLSRGTTYYGWTKRTNVSGTAISTSGSRTMSYNAPSSLGDALDPNDNNSVINLIGAPSTFLVKFRSLSSTSQYRLIGPSGTARDWFTPSGNETNSTGVTSSVTFQGAGGYTMQSRRPITSGGDNTTVVTASTLTVQALTGSFSYATQNATAGTVSPSVSGNYNSVSYAKVSGSGTVNTTTGAVTWAANEDSSSRTTVVRATFTDIDNNELDVDATATQQGGALASISYSDKNAASGTVAPNVSGTYSSISYTKLSGSSEGSLNTSTGVVTWPDNLTTSDRSITVRVTVSRNGDTDTADITSTQLGGPGISFSYANQLASGGTISPSANHTGTVGTYSKVSGSSSATVNSTTGQVSWAQNEAATSRSCNVSVDVTRNGLTRSATATSTQLAGATITSFSYPDITAAGGQVLALTNESSSSISFAIVSGTGATVNSSDGTLTWTANESAASRTVTVRLTASRNGDTDTQDAVATQQGGVQITAFSYATKNGAAGAGSAPTYTTNPTSGVTNGNFSITAGTGATIDASTGVLTWTENPGSSDRSVTVSRTSSRNGDSDTATATATQQGSSDISAFSYSNKNAAAGAGSAPSITTAGGTNSYSIPTTAYATINSSTGVITWTTNEGSSNRSVTVTVTNTRNGTTSTATATATQTRGILISAFSYSTKNAAAGAGSAPTVTTNPATGTSRSYSLVSNSISATINSSTGVITWPLNEGTSSRTVTARLTASYNGDTDTADFVATQQGGASATLSYATKNAVSGTVSPTISGTYSSVSYSKVSGDAAASINSSTGVVTWSANNSTSSRTATFRATVSRNGDTDTVDAVSTQQGGPGVSGTYTYSNVLNADGSYTDPSGSPTFTGTAGDWSVTGTGVSIVASGTNAGRVTWTANTGSTNRSGTVYRQVTRNGYTRTLSVGTTTQLAPPTGGSFALTADAASLDAGQNTVVRATASSLNSGSDYSNRLIITPSPSGTDDLDETITGVTALTGNVSTQNVTTRTPNAPTSVTYSGQLIISQLGPPDGEGIRIPYVVETRTASVTVNWSAIPTDDFTQNPIWNQANANANSTATLSQTAIANGTPQGSVSYAMFDANQPASINSSTGQLTWERNPGSTSRTATITVTGSNSAFQPGGASYSQNFTATQKAGPGVSFSYPTAKNATSGNQTPTTNHVGSVTYEVTSGAGATVNTSTGVLTWTANESTSDRTVTVTATVTNNGDTRTGTAVATQYGGTAIVSFSYATKNAAAGDVTPTVDVTPDSTLGFRLTQGSGATINPLTGTLSWGSQESEDNRVVTVEITATRNGLSKVDTVDATQLGGVEVVDFSYPQVGAASSSASPQFTSITAGASTSYSISSGTGATIDTNTGVLTWEDNVGSQDRTVTVSLSSSRNGDVDIESTVATQISQVVSASIIGDSSSDSNVLQVLSGVLSGLAPGVTVVSYTWSLTVGTIVSGQGTNQIEVDWSSVTQNEVAAIDLSIEDSLGRVFAAPTKTVNVTYVSGTTPPTTGTGGYGIEFANAAGEIILRGDEVLTRKGQTGTVDATRQTLVSGLDTTARVTVSLSLTSPVADGFYTVANTTSTSKTITFGSGVPVGTEYTIIITR